MSSEFAQIEGPFSGLKVVDLTQGIAGPYCGTLLAHYGAEVIKIEPPEGDWIRAMGPGYGQMTAFYIAFGRGKKAMVVNLKDARGLDVVRRLARGAAVFMESNRAGIAKRLGIGYEALSAENAELVYLSVTGFGQHGRYHDRPATDGVMQAFSGLMTRKAAFLRTSADVNASATA